MTRRHGIEKMETDEPLIAKTSEAKVKEGRDYVEECGPLEIEDPHV